MNTPIRIRNSYGEVAIIGDIVKITAGSNMSIDAGGTVFLGTTEGGCQVDIGGPNSTININGNLNINGVPYGA